jgi:hypothetical protein
MEKQTNEPELLPLEPGTSHLIFLKKKLLHQSFEGSDSSGKLLMTFSRPRSWSRNANGFWHDGEVHFRYPKWYSRRVEVNIHGLAEQPTVARKFFWRTDHIQWFNHRLTFVQKGFFLRHYQLIDQNEQVVLDWHITERFLSFRLESTNDGRIFKLPHPEALNLLCLFLILQRIRDAQAS